jgi:hypothetical protein
MTYRTISRAAVAFLLWTAVVGASGAPAAPPAARPGAASTGVMPLDLTTGMTDITPLQVTDPVTNEAFDPQTPPQTVEGTLVSVDATGQSATVRTKRNGDVKMGLPPDVYLSRKGELANVGDMKPGDRIWATVETAHGVRAIRVVFAAPFNPLISWIGIPVLLLIALGIWWTGRSAAGRDERAQPVRA